MQLRILGITAAAVLVAAWSAHMPDRVHLDDYSADLSGAKETPPNSSKGTGSAMVSISGTQLHYMITVHGLTGPAKVAHIHAGKPGESGPPLLKLQIKSLAGGQIANDSVDLTQSQGMGGASISPDSLMSLIANGAAYVNVHTAAFPNGEVRGQLAKQ